MNRKEQIKNAVLEYMKEYDIKDEHSFKSYISFPINLIDITQSIVRNFDFLKIYSDIVVDKCCGKYEESVQASYWSDKLEKKIMISNYYRFSVDTIDDFVEDIINTQKEIDEIEKSIKI